MCYLITVGIPENVDPPTLPSPPGGTALTRHRNEGGGHVHGHGYDAYRLTDAHCSCSLYSSSATAGKPRQYSEEWYRSKFARRGWSPTRIERAVTEALATRASRASEDFTGLHPAVRAFLARCAEALGEVRLIVHFHDDPFASEPFVLRETRTLTRQELVVGSPSVLEDRLYVIR